MMVYTYTPWMDCGPSGYSITTFSGTSGFEYISGPAPTHFQIASKRSNKLMYWVKTRLANLLFRFRISREYRDFGIAALMYPLCFNCKEPLPFSFWYMTLYNRFSHCVCACSDECKTMLEFKYV